MKKAAILLMLPMLIVPVAAFCQSKQIEIIAVEHHDAHYDDFYEIFEGQDLFAYDSVTFSDGSYAVYQVKFAPQNSLTRYVGRSGRVIATVALASERYPQHLVYGYDGRGRLKYLLRFNGMLDPYYHRIERDYLYFRHAIDSVDFRNPDLERHKLTEIIYGNDGTARRITEQPTGNEIEAPEGYKLVVSVVPCAEFWNSDLSGGHFLLKADMVPISKAAGDYTVKHFEDFLLTGEEYYEDGVLQDEWQADN